MKHITIYSAKKKLNAGNRRHRIYLKRKLKAYNTNDKIDYKKYKNYQILKVCNNLSLYDKDIDISKTIDFARKLKKYILKFNCLIDFTSTSRVTAAAVLFLYGYIDSIKEPRNFKSKVIWSRHESVNSTIRSMKLNKIIEGHKVSCSFDSGSDLSVVSGYGSQYQENIMNYIRDNIYSRLDQQFSERAEMERVYSDAISETINNVHAHAYPKCEPKDRTWWLTCEIIQNDLYLAIYDVGIGIPDTITSKVFFMQELKKIFPTEHKKLTETLNQQGDKNNFFVADHHLVFLSMQGDVSGTADLGRGQGSKSMEEWVNSSTRGKLWVFSGKGKYTYDSIEKTPRCYRLTTSLPGTLIQWNIKIK